MVWIRISQLAISIETSIVVTTSYYHNYYNYYYSYDYCYMSVQVLHKVTSIVKGNVLYIQINYLGNSLLIGNTQWKIDPGNYSKPGFSVQGFFYRRVKCWYVFIPWHVKIQVQAVTVRVMSIILRFTPTVVLLRVLLLFSSTNRMIRSLMIYIYIYLSLSIYVYIYIYIERERDFRSFACLLN